MKGLAYKSQPLQSYDVRVITSGDQYLPVPIRSTMDLENFPEIDKSNLPKLKQYWDYLNSYRAKVDESTLISSDIANIFTSLLDDKK